MDSYSVNEPSQKKSNRSKWFIGCGTAFVVILCIVLFIIFGGFAGLLALFGGEPVGLTVNMAQPTSPLSIGEEFSIDVHLVNEGTKNLTISQIKIPNNLLEVAQVTGVTHGGTAGLDFGEQTGYDFNIEIAPNGQQTVQFLFRAVAEGDINGDLDVVVGTKTSTNAISLSVIGDDGGVAVGPAADPGTTSLIPYKSVVQIIAIVDLDGEHVEGWTGSGTIISDDGLILTNAHVVLSDRYYEVVDLIVAITKAEDEPPERMFYADVIQADAQLDLAVIKIRSDLSGGAVNFASLGIQPVPLGNSDSLSLGDSIVIIGYPGIGGETITLTRGEVSGFTSEAPYGNRAYIKTSATIAGGNSGGLAANPQGEIIGVPSAVGTGDIEDEFVDCRRLADTNRDGVIDEYDNCVPTGGFINALRPIQLALPMIQAAQAGQVAIQESAGGGTQEEYEAEGDVIFTDTFDNNANGWLTGVFDDGSIVIENGVYQIELNNVDSYFLGDRPEVYSNIVLVVEAQVTHAAGDGEFGFVCDVQDNDDFTALEITEDGYAAIWKFENGEFVSLVDWTFYDVIADGGVFQLSAYCGPDRLTLAVGDMIVAQGYDPGYQSGRVGLFVWPFETPDLQVTFDNFYLLRP
ncbi:MAG: trypsin-like peptidase domain-containing protein [Anaerolineaceae bacterium]|nr:trypsin-like peptidase domain-containing protein [Anaerolineaceae bacterium]